MPTIRPQARYNYLILLQELFPANALNHCKAIPLKAASHRSRLTKMQKIGVNCIPRGRGEGKMASVSVPKTIHAASGAGPILDDEIVKAANEAANDQIEAYSEKFSHDFAAAAEEESWTEEATQD